MRPTKRTKVHRVESPIPSHTGAPISKLLKLKYRINDVYRYKDRSPQLDDTITKSDKNWVMGEIHNLRNDGWLTATKMKVANEMWDKYGG